MKKVYFCYYAHESALNEIVDEIKSFEDTSLLSQAVYYMFTHNLSWDVCKYNSKDHTISLIQVPTWDVRYEPVVGDSYLFKEYDCPPKIIIGNKTVYHRKHEFVSDKYQGFDIEQSKRRTRVLEPIPWIRQNKSRIGSKRIWEEFLKEYHLPKYML